MEDNKRLFIYEMMTMMMMMMTRTTTRTTMIIVVIIIIMIIIIIIIVIIIITKHKPWAKHQWYPAFQLVVHTIPASNKKRTWHLEKKDAMFRHIKKIKSNKVNYVMCWRTVNINGKYSYYK